MTMLITKLIDAARDDLLQMGRREIARSHAAGVPGVYSSSPSGSITYDFPDGRKVTIPHCLNCKET